MSGDFFTKTQRYGFFKPTAGCLNWGELFSVNWEIVEAILSRQEAAINDLDKKIDALTKQVWALTPETYDDDD